MTLAVADPYKALDLPHSATAEQIKKSYRQLARQYHPDRLVAASPEEQQRGATRFAQISSAYALLNDAARKKQYDHVYKFGGFDNNNNNSPSNNSNLKDSNINASTEATTQSPQNHRKRKTSTGIGYRCYDPLAFIWTNGKVNATSTIAGIEIPSRLQMARNTGNTFRFAFSAGQYSSSQEGIRKYTSKTLQFCDGKKYTRTETTTVYPDGRKEVVIEGDDYERRYCTPPKKSKQQEDVSRSEESQLPWYMSAWNGVKGSLQMCYSPCAVAAQ